MVMHFIANYKKRKNFWLRKSWGLKTASERLVNWFMSYFFFASGSDDHFQAVVLSSLAEHYSHILKTYKAEETPYIRIYALKALLFSYAFMFGDQKSKIKNIVAEMCTLMEEIFDETGFIRTGHPIEHFNMFKTLLEIRFVARKFSISFPEYIFHEKLSDIASCVRFLRLGDGLLSKHNTGDKIDSLMIPRSHSVDSALSLVDSRYFDEKKNKVTGFERIFTKKIIVLINTNRPVRLMNRMSKDIGIYGFEASIGALRIIEKSSISIRIMNTFIRAEEFTNRFYQKKVLENQIRFEGEISGIFFGNRFAIRREISIHKIVSEISVLDYVYAENAQKAVVIVFLPQDAYCKKTSDHSVAIASNNKNFIFRIDRYSCGVNIRLPRPKQNANNLLCLEFLESISGEQFVKWSIEELE
jgi:hypothetical protein